MKLAKVDPLKVELIAPTEYFGQIKKGMQIAGSTCTTCAKKVLIAKKGVFCPGCDKCFYGRCVGEGRCVECDGSLQEQDQLPEDWTRGALVPGATGGLGLLGLVSVALGTVAIAAAVAVWVIHGVAAYLGLGSVLKTILLVLIGGTLLTPIIRR